MGNIDEIASTAPAPKITSGELLRTNFRFRATGAHSSFLRALLNIINFGVDAKLTPFDCPLSILSKFIESGRTITAVTGGGGGAHGFASGAWARRTSKNCRWGLFGY